MCIRVCPRVRLCLPLRSPNLLLLESALLMAVLLSTKSNCGALLDGNAGMEHKKTGFTIIYRCKKIVLWKNINIFANYLRGVFEK